MASSSFDRSILRHFLASIAYHLQKAVRGAPAGFWTFSAGNRIRTPEGILLHMTCNLGHTCTRFTGGRNNAPASFASIETGIEQFHKVLEDLASLLSSEVPLREISEYQLLQGPLSDVMTHIGQLSLLRRLYGSPVPPENFIYADISADRLGPDQPEPRRPDSEWPEGPAGTSSGRR